MMGGPARCEHLVVVFPEFSSAAVPLFIWRFDTLATVGVLCCELFVGSVMHLQCHFLLYGPLLY